MGGKRNIEYRIEYITSLIDFYIYQCHKSRKLQGYFDVPVQACHNRAVRAHYWPIERGPYIKRPVYLTGGHASFKHVDI